MTANTIYDMGTNTQYDIHERNHNDLSRELQPTLT